jgi:hypothetical protein
LGQPSLLLFSKLRRLLELQGYCILPRLKLLGLFDLIALLADEVLQSLLLLPDLQAQPLPLEALPVFAEYQK